MCIRDSYNTLCFFFFQAEDGIRDHAQSRGLGDVYKRQVLKQILPEIGATIANLEQNKTLWKERVAEYDKILNEMKEKKKQDEERKKLLEQRLVIHKSRPLPCIRLLSNL
eukprot:TRINITY_DN2104_c0_g1_i1.p2 TRINITY_DN2104_c0_g1~~TRINITY_DN2104_c0_g1_i1.p2  ORF type:complete len:126 (+),score=55.28 TRINITY_DN2104_c0_g1_i1:49-378(+)